MCFQDIFASECGNVNQMADSQSEAKQDFKTFEFFFRLPLDIQKIIISYLWRPKIPDKTLGRGLCGQKVSIERGIPVSFLTYHNNIPKIVEVGVIGISKERDFVKLSMFGGYKEIIIKTTYLHLNNPLTNIRSKITSEEIDLKILSTAFSIHGNLAILWIQENTKNTPHYVSYFALADIKLGTINLDNNKRDVTHLIGAHNNKRILFDISGNKTIIFGQLGDAGTNIVTTSFNISEFKKELTFVQQCKRLGINTPEVKELLKKKS